MSDKRERPWDISKYISDTRDKDPEPVCKSHVEGLSELSPLEAEMHFPSLPKPFSISDEDVNYLFSKEASNTESRKRLRKELKAYREAKAKWERERERAEETE
ncbi:hypothetical protein BSP10_055 [Bacillus phage BSP10]|uniref:Uncharacterized protein n=1 Tax=Bacillus phage phiNIT1 TaxID=207656 RepID=S6B1N4_9CAUD|nr:hypothetical protein N374_gp217 [Bacillus phage phiNIT1]YP_010581886.1 hypothetical protein IM043_gp065 [Bacillus phage SPG24]AUO79458.1 hypothetical protein BSP10_055 [Bacillus phage BSP10]QRI44716.1 terminase large subunit [Bacillus phage BSTP3]BAN59644.1 hypothetical protein [Bacillus phage phiNIT1]